MIAPGNHKFLGGHFPLEKLSFRLVGSVLSRVVFVGSATANRKSGMVAIQDGESRPIGIELDEQKIVELIQALSLQLVRIREEKP